MENKIQELTDKIYREGVEKGNEEAQKLIAKAQEEAKRIIEDAHKEADSIVATAHKSADELAENTKSELKLFAGQAVNALKSEIATLVTDNIVNADVKAFAANKDYLNAFTPLSSRSFAFAAKYFVKPSASAVEITIGSFTLHLDANATMKALR